MPGQPSPDAAALESEGLRVLQITRNTRKLRRGIHQGNRFTIRLREPDFDVSLAALRWTLIVAKGAPNFFGPQRFGHDGRNVAKALAMFRHEFKPQDRLLRGLLLSAVRSHLFNEIVKERLARGIWDVPLKGEVFGFADNGTLLLPERHRGDEAERFQNGIVELTAPLWGNGELQSVDEVRAMEMELPMKFPELTTGLEACGLRQERRVIRLRPTNPAFEILDNGDLQISFDLPKGTYATTLLREMVELDER